jgi:outer membrane receptor for ferrienterochelin and colicins
MKPVSRLKPVPVEVYKPVFLRKTNHVYFEALQNVNGVRPQLNCNVCNTGRHSHQWSGRTLYFSSN